MRTSYLNSVSGMRLILMGLYEMWRGRLKIVGQAHKLTLHWLAYALILFATDCQ